MVSSPSEDPRAGPVAVVGAGVAGLITAYTLLRDGFTDVQVLTRDAHAGGVWAPERIYPGLYSNNVHGEYRLSPMKMAHRPKTGALQGRLSGEELSEYFQSFAHKFLDGKILYGREVQRIRRDASGEGWEVDVLSIGDGTTETRNYARIVLCTGGCSSPRIPHELSPKAADAAGFTGPVIHTAEFAERMQELLSYTRPVTFADANSADEPSVIVVGGGKSAHDMCASLANEGRKVTLVCHNLDYFLASTSPLPEFIRKSRFLSLLSPHIHLRTYLERFLHTTWLGALLVHFIWSRLIESAFQAAKIPKGSPLRNVASPFWSVRANDEGVPRSNGFHALALAGKIQVITPAHVTGFGQDGKSVMLEDGRRLAASAVVLATGYRSSWEDLFDERTLDEVGLSAQPANPQSSHRWDYASLSNPPPLHPDAKRWSSTVYRGIVPAKNIMKRNLAVNGTGISMNNGYTAEVVAHWISSYFLGDPMRLPESTEAALEATEREAAWLKQRHPQTPTALNPSYTAYLSFLSWPQYTDDLLEDMGLRVLRSGGNWLTWPFKVIDLDEIGDLKEERDARRAKLASVRA
ncbi:FAD/NAD-P-binding domain-containing protein [Trametes sanguinea]|nr:FAD/NAD-P-binding domain-containing protein [Trametes sanguinea]